MSPSRQERQERGPSGDRAHRAGATAPQGERAAGSREGGARAARQERGAGTGHEQASRAGSGGGAAFTAWGRSRGVVEQGSVGQERAECGPVRAAQAAGSGAEMVSWLVGAPKKTHAREACRGQQLGNRPTRQIDEDGAERSAEKPE